MGTTVTTANTRRGGTSLEAATLAGFRSVLHGASMIVIVPGEIRIYGHAGDGIADLADALQLSSHPNEDRPAHHAIYEVHRGRVGDVRIRCEIEVPR